MMLKVKDSLVHKTSHVCKVGDSQHLYLTYGKQSLPCKSLIIRLGEEQIEHGKKA